LSEILSVAALVCMFLVFITAVLLYYCRPRNEKHVTEGFQSISGTFHKANTCCPMRLVAAEVRQQLGLTHKRTRSITQSLLPQLHL